MMRSLQLLPPALALVAAAQVPTNRFIVEFAEVGSLHYPSYFHTNCRADLSPQSREPHQRDGRHQRGPDL